MFRAFTSRGGHKLFFGGGAWALSSEILRYCGRPIKKWNRLGWGTS